MLEFLIDRPVLGNVDEGPIALSYNTEVSCKINKVIGVDLAFEALDFQDPQKEQAEIANQEMAIDRLLLSDIDRSCIKI